MDDLANEVERLYEGMGGAVKFYSLGMPLTLRSNGGLGTHRMLPANVNFNIPLNEEKSGGFDGCKTQRISGKKTRELVDRLHISTPAQEDISEKQKVIWSWVCTDDYSRHQQVWKELIQQAKNSDFQNPSCQEFTGKARCP